MFEWFTKKDKVDATPEYTEFDWKIHHLTLGHITVRAACVDVGTTGAWFRDQSLAGILFVPTSELGCIQRVDCAGEEVDADLPGTAD